MFVKVLEPEKKLIFQAFIDTDHYIIEKILTYNVQYNSNGFEWANI